MPRPTRSTHRTTRGVTVALVLLAVLGACTRPPPPQTGEQPVDDASAAVPDADADGIDPERYCEAGDGDGTVRWAHDREPEDLLIDPVDGRAVAGWIRHGVHEGLYTRSTDGELVPELLVDDAEVGVESDGQVTLRYQLRDGLRFSDGTPITGQTVRDTYDLLVTDDGEGARRLGDLAPYGRIVADSWEVDRQEVTVRLDRPYAGWRSLFSRLLPTHTFDDLDDAEASLRELLDGDASVPASGPFTVSAWERGDRLILTRDESYHGAHPDRVDVRNPGAACVGTIELSFVADADAQALALRDGEADLAIAPPQEALVDLAEVGLDVAVAPDPAVEHWVLNTTGPHLNDPRVREALATAIDRAEMVDRLHVPLLGDAVPAGGHGSALFGPGDGADPQGDAGLAAGDHGRAAELLREAGYERNAASLFEHPERGPLSLRLSTTGGDRLRERQQQLLQTRLNAEGWDVSIDNRDGLAHLDEQVLVPTGLACAAALVGDVDADAVEGADRAACDLFDISQIAWETTPWPGSAAERFAGQRAMDPTGFTSADFVATLDRCPMAGDTGDTGDAGDGAARRCLDQLDRSLVTRSADPDGLVLVPLAVRPHLIVSSPERLRRVPALSPSAQAGPLGVAVDLLTGRADGT